MKPVSTLSLDAWASMSSEGVLVVEPDGTISMFNPSLKSLLYLDAVPNSVDELLKVTGDTIPELATLLKMAVRSEQVRWGNLVVRRQPSQRLTWQQIPLHDEGKFIGTITVIREASGQGADLTKQSFLSMISHDLRTPLSTILGFAELMYNNRDSLSGEEQEEFLRHIIKNANDLTAYTQIALDILFLEANLQAFEVESASLSSAVQRWLADAKHRLSADRILFQTGPEDAPLVRLAPPALYRVLDILVEFALVESPPDERVLITLTYNAAQAHLVIRHKAPDLSKDDAVMLFQMMHPRDLSESGRPKLHRMQLYVASLLAQRQQGYLALHVLPKSTYEIDLALLLATDSAPGIAS